MERRQKKILIILGSVGLALIVFCVIFALMFRLKTVDVEFRSRAVKTNLPAETYCSLLYFLYDKFIMHTSLSYNYFSYDGINWLTEYKGLIQNSEDITTEIKDLILEEVATKEYVDEAISGIGTSNVIIPQPHLVLTDTATGIPYKIEITNGNLVSSPLEET